MPAPTQLPAVRSQWTELLEGGGEFESCLLAHVRERRWFGGKARRIRSLAVQSWFPVPGSLECAGILLLKVEYESAASEHYQLPVALVPAAEAPALPPQFVIARLRIEDRAEECVLFDAAASAGFANALLGGIAAGETWSGEDGALTMFATPALGRMGDAPLLPRVSGAEHSNTAILFGDKLILKFFRRIEPGVHPDLEIGRFLSARGFAHTPALAGGLLHTGKDGVQTSLGILSQFVAGSIDAWQFTMSALDVFFSRADKLPPSPQASQFEDAVGGIPGSVIHSMGDYAESARLLGERTAALHRCLASGCEDRDFSPQAVSAEGQRVCFDVMRSQTAASFRSLRDAMETLPAEMRQDAARVLEREDQVLASFAAAASQPPDGWDIRVHGDYHLGQVLWTGRDFLIIDFEGEPARPLAERRAKQSPLKDVAGMLRSFDYAAQAALLKSAGGMESHADYWSHWAGVIFLAAYIEGAKDCGFLPSSAAAFSAALRAQLVAKAGYELLYELNNRPRWARIPLRGILRLASW